jgi:hypothetical protein
MIRGVLDIAGVVCLFLVPPLVISSFVLALRLGSAIRSKNPSVWDEMKPGFYSDIRVSIAHQKRFREFLSSREYQELNDPRISRLAVLCRISGFALAGAMCGGAAMLIWSNS